MAKPEAPKELKTWYDVVQATTDVLPWREEGGVQVLGAVFETATRGEMNDAVMQMPGTVPQPTPTPAGAPADTPEQAYGRMVHQLLQGLPLPAATPLAEDAVRDATQVRAALPWLWAQGSRAEVAMVLENGTIGRADRVVPYNGVWWVIDFKTGAPQQPVPEKYATQLQGYAKALQASLPEAVIKTAIVWVATATLAETAWNG